MAHDTITIQTTQNVSIDYDLAKTGARIGAFTLDLVLLTIFYYLLVLVFYTVAEDSLNELILIVFGPLVTLLGYFFLMETFNQGQSLGKMVISLRVIRLDGRDPTPEDFLARAIFLLVDVVFTLGMGAVFLVSIGRNKQRLGDITAGTAVIYTNARSMFTLEEILSIRKRDEYETRFEGVQRYTDEDMMIVKQTLGRLRRYGNPAHHRAARTLILRICEQLDLDPSQMDMTPEQFLENILMDYIVVTR